VANLVDYAILAPALTGFGRTCLFDEVTVLAAVRANDLDLLILVPRNNWWCEVDGIADLQAAATRAQIAVLAMVPAGDARALAHAFDHGVADCAPYPIDAAETAVRVAALLRRKSAADRLRADAAAVRRLALTDPVTGLWNRHYLDTELADRIATAAAGGRTLSVLMIDIDAFKPINDRHGHAIGDKALRAVAMRLSAGIRTNDTLARFGGDELVLVMPDTGIDAAAIVAELLRALVADGTTEVPFGLTISIGVAELLPGEAATALIERADKALYAAKLDGRNRVAAAS
jgi:two-component system cell cycle response regulator